MECSVLCWKEADICVVSETGQLRREGQLDGPRHFVFLPRRGGQGRSVDFALASRYATPPDMSIPAYRLILAIDKAE